MPKTIKIEKINKKRMAIKAKGYITRSEAGDYCGCTQRKGRQIYDCIKKELEANGKRINACGIAYKAFNEYLEITDEQILENAKMGY